MSGRCCWRSADGYVDDLLCHIGLQLLSDRTASLFKSPALNLPAQVCLAESPDMVLTGWCCADSVQAVGALLLGGDGAKARLGMIGAVVLARTLLQDRIASLNGRSVEHVLRQDRPAFVRLIGLSVLQARSVHPLVSQ